ncbi:MAG TPA: PaaI family thioesterase, partial [Bacteroidales bacterium]|nr:PaaI family thioesterase [Bacteroidales bacterium]
MNAQEFFRNDRFAQLLGIELLEIGEGRARTKLEISDEHLNALNIVHGGVIFTLADFTMAAAANSSEYTAVAINANVSFLKAGKRGTLFAEAIETSRNNKLAT